MRQLATLVIILGVLVVGCAKRPQLLQASAPAPTGVAAPTPGPAARPTPEVTTPGTQPGAPALQPPAATAPQPPAAVQRPAPAPQPPGPTPQPAPALRPPAAQPPTAARPAEPSPQEQFADVAALKDVHFDFDKYDIRPDAARVLDANIDWMRSNPDAVVLVEGHCDERGTNEYNLALGERRARSTMNYLIAHGVSASRIKTISYGEERPVCMDRNETCWARNRRAHFLARTR